jgi:hypothetical protein
LTGADLKICPQHTQEVYAHETKSFTLVTIIDRKEEKKGQMTTSIFTLFSLPDSNVLITG